jgi:hypothetical protein
MAYQGIFRRFFEVLIALSQVRCKDGSRGSIFFSLVFQLQGAVKHKTEQALHPWNKPLYWFQECVFVCLRV